MSKNYGRPEKDTTVFVDYICAVIGLMTNLCIDEHEEAIKLVKSCGVDESHILCCVSADNHRLVIHEKLK